MKKIYEIGAKTGLNAKEVNRITGFGLLGLLTLGLAALSACGFKAQKPAPASVEARPQTLQDLANSVKDMDAADGKKAAAPTISTGTATDKNCGPYPGYPCGTRYYTVSRADFRRAA